MSRARSSSEVANQDLRDLMAVLGISQHARPVSPHEVFQAEVLPYITELKRMYAWTLEYVTALERRLTPRDIDAAVKEANNE